jgi:hypothetical protein
MGFAVYPTNGRQSRMNGNVVRTQQFRLLFHVELTRLWSIFEVPLEGASPSHSSVQVCAVSEALIVMHSH